MENSEDKDKVDGVVQNTVVGVVVVIVYVVIVVLKCRVSRRFPWRHRRRHSPSSRCRRRGRYRRLPF